MSRWLIKMYEIKKKIYIVEFQTSKLVTTMD